MCIFRKLETWPVWSQHRHMRRSERHRKRATQEKVERRAGFRAAPPPLQAELFLLRSAPQGTGVPGKSRWTGIPGTRPGSVLGAWGRGGSASDAAGTRRWPLCGLVVAPVARLGQVPSSPRGLLHCRAQPLCRAEGGVMVTVGSLTLPGQGHGHPGPQCGLQGQRPSLHPSEHPPPHHARSCRCPEPRVSLGVGGGRPSSWGSLTVSRPLGLSDINSRSLKGEDLVSEIR